MGREGQITVHGFRSTFRDYIAEKQSWMEILLNTV
jgi:hypothetical protein